MTAWVAAAEHADSSIASRMFMAALHSSIAIAQPSTFARTGPVLLPEIRRRGRDMPGL
jgi:hypothetical protein